MRRAVVLLTAGLLPLAGCAWAFDAGTIRTMQPQRAADMEHLDAFVGQWETTAENEVLCLGKKFPIQGTTENAWDAGRWFLVERGQYEMGELGTVSEVGIWTYDPSAKTFRTWRFDSFGGERRGTAKFDPQTGVWSVRARRRSSWGSTLDRGTIRVVDAQTLEWTWKEWSAWDPLRLFQLAEFSGTSRRK